MRKVIVLEFVTLDGVIQAGGAPEEDTSGGFAYGGWQAPYSDDVEGAVLFRQRDQARPHSSRGAGDGDVDSHIKLSNQIQNAETRRVG